VSDLKYQSKDIKQKPNLIERAFKSDKDKHHLIGTILLGVLLLALVITAGIIIKNQFFNNDKGDSSQMTDETFAEELENFRLLRRQSPAFGTEAYFTAEAKINDLIDRNQNYPDRLETLNLEKADLYLVANAPRFALETLMNMLNTTLNPSDDTRYQIYARIIIVYERLNDIPNQILFIERIIALTPTDFDVPAYYTQRLQELRQ
jgi:hypothetical protein